MLANLDTLPSFFSSPTQTYGNASAPVSPHEWMTGTPYSEDSGYMSVYDRDEFGSRGEVGYLEEVWDGRRDVELREGGNGDSGGIFLEQCHSKHCFFGCGASHLPSPCHVEENRLFNREWNYEFEGVQHRHVDRERERMFEIPYKLDIGRANGFLQSFPLLTFAN
jgi:hypothetical protein